MESRNRYDGVDARAVFIIRYHARHLARSNAVPGMDVEDFEQDLMLDLLRRQNKYDAATASFATFADHIVGNRVATITKPTARLRAEKQMVSLDEPMAGPDGDETVSRGDLLAEDGVLTSDPQRDDAADLRRDVNAYLADLTTALRRCADIIASENVVGATRAAGLHRSTVYEAVRRLRDKASRAGLDIYLGRTPTTANLGR